MPTGRPRANVPREFGLRPMYFAPGNRSDFRSGIEKLQLVGSGGVLLPRRLARVALPHGDREQVTIVAILGDLGFHLAPHPQALEVLASKVGVEVWQSLRDLVRLPRVHESDERQEIARAALVVGAHDRVVLVLGDRLLEMLVHDPLALANVVHEALPCLSWRDLVTGFGAVVAKADGVAGRPVVELAVLVRH